MHNLQFRPFSFSDADYEAVIAVRNAALPDYIETVEDWHHWDQTRPAHCVFERWVAEREGQIVAYGSFSHMSGMFHPQKFYLDVFTHPAHQSCGIAGQLYEHLLGRLAPYNPILLRAEAREDHRAAIHLLQKHGYTEEMRFWESRLAVAPFDPSPWEGHTAKVLAQGITIITLRDLMDRGGDYRTPLYEAITEMARDVPSPDPYTPPGFEQWAKTHLGHPNLLPEGYFIALHEGRIAGVSQLWLGAEPDVLYTGLTATRRDYRRKGIALALKLRAVAFAQQRGAREIRTGNETRNRPMLSINEALGFVKQPVWVSYARQL
ncbi:MAG: GNAT family N-acetyltransferase [Chloroflexi bacterium OHK40]